MNVLKQSWAHEGEWAALARRWIGLRPVTSNPQGQQRVRDELAGILRNLGFSVTKYSGPPGSQAVLVALRAPEPVEGAWVGLSGVRLHSSDAKAVISSWSC